MIERYKYNMITVSNVSLQFGGDTQLAFAGGPKGVEMQSVFLAPLPITKDNLNVVIDAGWITKEAACQGVTAGSVAACN